MKTARISDEEEDKPEIYTTEKSLATAEVK